MENVLNDVTSGFAIVANAHADLMAVISLIKINLFILNVLSSYLKHYQTFNPSS